MTLLIGTDEAGYGPNLGPLIVSCSVWRAPPPWTLADLYTLLEKVVTNAPGTPRRLVVADSKRLYKPRGSMRPLEGNLLPLLQICGQEISSWRRAFEQLAPGSMERAARIPWYADYDAPLPLAWDLPAVAELREMASREFARQRVELVDVSSRVVFPREFNQLTDALGTKGALLTQLTLDLIARALDRAGDESIQVGCDKHGGRSKYGPVLQQRFPDYLVEVVSETPLESVYRWGPAQRRVEVRFVAKGERFLPVALASMASKYLRELAMLALNSFWQRQLPGLQPTAGYPVDAVRFRAEIAEVRTRLQIDDAMLWRNR